MTAIQAIARRFASEIIVVLLFLGTALLAIVLSARAHPAVPSSEPPPAATVTKALLRRTGSFGFSLDSAHVGSQIDVVASAAHPEITVPAGTPVILFGWATDSEDKSVASGVILQIDGVDRVVADYGIPRPDIQKIMSGFDALHTGFTATIPAVLLPMGKHTISALVVDSSGSAFYWLPDRLRIVVQ